MSYRHYILRILNAREFIVSAAKFQAIYYTAGVLCSLNRTDSSNLHVRQFNLV